MIWTLSSTKVVLNLSVSQKWRKPKQEAELWFLQLMVRGLSFQPLTLQPLCSSSYVHRLASKVPSSAVVKVVLSLSLTVVYVCVSYSRYFWELSRRYAGLQPWLLFLWCLGGYLLDFKLSCLPMIGVVAICFSMLCNLIVLLLEYWEFETYEDFVFCVFVFWSNHYTKGKRLLSFFILFYPTNSLLYKNKWQIHIANYPVRRYRPIYSCY